MRRILVLVFVTGVLAEVLSAGEWCSKKDTYKNPAKGTCVGYWNCNKGNITYERCSILHSFDSKKHECVWNPTGSAKVPCGFETGPEADDKWCSVGRTYRAPVNGLCNSYFDCQDGNLELKSCMWPLKFNPKERVCRLNVWPVEFACFSIPVEEPKSSTTSDSTSASDSTTSTPGSTISTPDSTASTPDTTAATHPDQPECEQGKNYDTVYPADCSKYYSCADGSLSIKDCGYFQKFDPTTLQCRYNYPWDSVNCKAPAATTTVTPSTTLGTTVTTLATTPAKTSATTRAPSKPEKKNVCLKGNYYTVPQVDNCQNYILCSNGSLSVKQCSTMHRFNPLTHQCEMNIPWVSTVDCSAKPDKPFCIAGYYYKMSLPGDSKKYYVCSNGSLTMESCGMMQSYVEDKEKCQYSWFGLSQELKEERMTQIRCRKGFNYNVSDPENCFNFMSCINGSLNFLQCPFAQKFDNKSGHCVPMTQCDLLTCRRTGGPYCYSGVNYNTSALFNCNLYYECKHGSLSLKTCPSNARFDPTTLTCRKGTGIDCRAKVSCNGKDPLVGVAKFQGEFIQLLDRTQELETPPCHGSDDFKAVDPKDCSSYFSCNKGKLETKQCSYLSKFDPKILTCRFDAPWNPVDCTSLPGQPACTRGQNFKTVFPEYCDRYYSCNNGSIKVETCHFWQKFDPTTLQCRLSIPWIYSVNCTAKHSNPVLIAVKRSTAVSTTTKPTSAPVKGPSCKVGQNFESIYPNDCKKYFDCSNGTENVEKCFWFREFDPSTLKCSWSLPFYRVNCTAVPGSGLPKPIVYPSRIRSICQKGVGFNSVVKGNCDDYYKCSNGSLTYEKCGWLKKFNPKTLKCSFDLPFHRVNCTAMPGEPNCPLSGLIRKPYPGDCSKYYECNKGTLRVLSCGFMQKFDHKKLECSMDLPFDRVNCGTDS